jgi:predicted amino acid dehydrogenase
MGGGPAIGFFQIEPATMYDVLDNYVAYRPQIKADLYALGYDDSDAEIRVMGNIALQVAFCRLCYRRDKNPIPKLEDMEAQAKYWKKVYNTELGKGTVKHFMEMNNG